MHIYLSPFLSNEKIFVKFNAILRQFIIKSSTFALDALDFFNFGYLKMVNYLNQ